MNLTAFFFKSLITCLTTCELLRNHKNTFVDAALFKRNLDIGVTIFNSLCWK